MFETLVHMDPPAHLHQMHQWVAKLMSNDDGPRDYLYAYDHDAELLYLRCEVPRPHLSAWRETPVPMVGQNVRVTGTIWIDPARRMFSPDRLRHWLIQRLSVAGFVNGSSVETAFRPGMPFGRPGSGRMRIAPMDISATIMVTHPEGVSTLLRDGLGHGKAYGFGALHFTPEAA